MKKVFILVSALGGSIVAYAQDKPEPLINSGLIYDLVHICAVLMIIYLISSFILQVVRQNFDFRLKSKVVERQTDEQIVRQIIPAEKTNPNQSILQWFCTLVGVGIGFLIMNLTQPFGLHSLAIMAFSVAAGLGIYYRWANRTK